MTPLSLGMYGVVYSKVTFLFFAWFLQFLFVFYWVNTTEILIWHPKWHHIFEELFHLLWHFRLVFWEEIPVITAAIVYYANSVLISNKTFRKWTSRLHKNCLSRLWCSFISIFSNRTRFCLGFLYNHRKLVVFLLNLNRNFYK